MTTSATHRPRSFATPDELGAIIREARTVRRLTQAEVAERAGVGRQWLVGLERGQRARAELSLVLRVLDVLDVKLLARLPG